MESWSSVSQLRITCTCRFRALAPSKLDARASGTAIRLRPHCGIGFHVTAAMEPRKSGTRTRDNRRKEKSFSPHLDDVDLKPDRGRIPSHTLEHLGFSDLRRRHLLRLLLGCRRGKIARYRGQRLAPAGEFERRPSESSSGCSVAETSSGWTVSALDETLKSRTSHCTASRRTWACWARARRHPMVGWADPSPSPSHCACFPFTLPSPVMSLSLYLRLIPNESLDVLRTIRRVVPPESPDPADPCLRCFLGDGVGVPCRSCSDKMSIEGVCSRTRSWFLCIALACSLARAGCES